MKIPSLVLLSTAVAILASSTASALELNPDNRAINYEIYQKITAVQEKGNDPRYNFEQQRRFLSQGMEYIQRANKENESLLDSIYSVNPEAFNRLAEIRLELFRDTQSIELLVERKSKEDSAKKAVGAAKGGLAAAYQISRPLKFPSDTSGLDPHVASQVREFNEIEEAICDLYGKIPLRFFVSHFRGALIQATSVVQKKQRDSQLEAMARFVREAQIGVTDLDSVTAEMGNPVSKTIKGDGSIVQYRWTIPEEGELENSWLTMTSQPKTVLAEFQFDSTGRLSFVCITRNDPKQGSTEELFLKGERAFASEQNPTVPATPW